MFVEFLKSLNWVDILMILLVIRIVFIGVKTGFVIEFFKLIGTIAAVFITLHYYVVFAKLFTQFQLKFVSMPIAQLIAFVLLWVAVIVVAKFVREGLLLLLKVEANNILNTWVGGLLSILRAVLVCSLVFIALYLPRIDYFQQNCDNSFSHPYLYEVAPNAYKGVYDGVVSKVFPQEKLNESIYKIKSGKI